MSCTQSRQLVKFPKVRVDKAWFRWFCDHKDFKNDGSLHLFSLMSLYSYSNFRSNTRTIEGFRDLYGGYRESGSASCPPFLAFFVHIPRRMR
jgi:hypothetical protein